MNRLYEVMEQLKADAILISSRHNMRYLTGYCGDTGIVLITRKNSYLLTDFRYITQAKNQAKKCKVIDIAGSGYALALADIIKEEGVKQVAFDREETSFAQYELYQNAFKDVTLIPYADEVDRLRMVKTKEELECIREAEHIGDLVFTEILNEFKPGVTEIMIAAKIEYLLKANGAEGISFDPIVASGINSSMPHAVPTHKEIEIGDFVTMDFGCIYQGYCSDMTRTIVIGKADEKQKQVYDTVLKAQRAVLNEVKAGMKGSKIDAIARDIIYSAGYEGCFGHGLGHSVGLFIHENPRASLKSNDIVMENMTLTVEPGIYIPDFGGVRIEDLVVITKDGCINYTHSPKDLIELKY